jgi:transcription elongation factor GreB
MSRAFVQESDDDFSADEVPAIKDPLPPGVKNYMTPAGAQRLKDELDELLNNEHPNLAAKLKGRIREGSGDVGKERRRLREMERRIQYLGGMMDRIEVVDPAQQDADRVHFGAKVTVRENGQDTRSYTIVGIDESDPSSGRISWISPLARALISRKVGDTARVALPTGEKTLRILGITYQ